MRLRIWNNFWDFGYTFEESKIDFFFISELVSSQPILFCVINNKFIILYKIEYKMC